MVMQRNGLQKNSLQKKDPQKSQQKEKVKIFKSRAKKVEHIKTRVFCLGLSLALLLSALFTYGPKHLPHVPTWEQVYAVLGLDSDSLCYQYPFVICFLSVGQGDCTLIRAEDQIVLIDTGPSGQEERIQSQLSKLEADDIDYCFITHLHEDHLGSLAELLGAVPIHQLLLTGEGYPGTLYQMAKEKNTTIEQPNLGQAYEIGGSRFIVMGPSFFGSDENNNSLILKIEYGAFSFLITGDAETEEEQSLSGELASTVLKVGHHGSKTSTSASFLQQVKPQYAVISCGKDNNYGHPHQETLDRLAESSVEVHRTDEEGSIIFATDGTELYTNQAA